MEKLGKVRVLFTNEWEVGTWSTDYITSGCGLIWQEQNNADVYVASAADHNALLHWCSEKCVPLVRELTFENAEVIILIAVSIFVQSM